MTKVYILLAFTFLFISNLTAQNVGIGTANPQEKLHIDGFLRGNQNGAVRISTGNGYIDIGPKNTSWSHFETDRARFYFNQGVTVNGGLIGSHTGSDLSLQTEGNTRISILRSNGFVGIGTTSPGNKLEVVGGSAVLSSVKTDGYAEDVSGIIQGNYVPSHSWSIGTGSVGIFSQNGSTSENERVWYDGPHGNRVIAWRGYGSGGDADGGWNSASFSIDHTKTYRVSVWLKKVGNTDGSTYLGCQGGQVQNLGGGVNGNPYFFSADLPQTGKWYLVVGYIHGSGDPSTTSYGGIYDGETGEKVAGTTDFKFTTSATTQVHRTYLYYNNTGGNEQYFWDPRFEEVNGKEPSISALVGMDVTSYVSNQDDWDKSGNDIYNNNSGNVGVGTASPTFKFEVAGDVYANGGWLRASGNQGLFFQTHGGGWYMTDATWIRTYNNKSIYQNTGTLRTDGTFQVGGSGSTFNVPNGGNLSYRTDVLFANTSGNVGAGTNAPTQKLDVNGQIRIRGGNPGEGKVLVSEADGTATWEKEGRGEFNSGTVAAGNWYRIAYNPGNRANAEFTLRDYISGGGHSTLKFVAGASFNNDGNMSFTVLSHSIYGTPTFTQVRILTYGTYDPMYLEVYCARDGSVDYSIVDNLQGSGWIPVDWTVGSVPASYRTRTYDVNNLFVVGDYQNRFTVSRGGDAFLAGRFKSNGINETSDARFKKDITPLEGSLQNVLQMRGVNYYWKQEEFPDKGFTEGKEIGVIAQEIEKIYPELVVTDKDGYKSVQYSHLVPVLIEAIKEQQALIESQKTQFDALSSELTNQAEISKNQEARLKYLEEVLLQQSKK